MKRIIFVSLFFLSLSAARAQNAEQAPAPTVKPVPEVLQVRETEHDFGKIPQGKPVYYFFEIINTSDVPLKLDNVQASCGCTTPEWSKDPIPAGGPDQIRVGFNAANEGPFEKPITITYNGSQTKQIKIKGTVWKAPVGSAPANQSVQFLKQQIQ
jgi:hypothetical protein